jgi:hypothetical protein
MVTPSQSVYKLLQRNVALWTDSSQSLATMKLQTARTLGQIFITSGVIKCLVRLCLFCWWLPITHQHNILFLSAWPSSFVSIQPTSLHSYCRRRHHFCWRYWKSNFFSQRHFTSLRSVFYWIEKGKVVRQFLKGSSSFKNVGFTIQTITINVFS